MSESNHYSGRRTFRRLAGCLGMLRRRRSLAAGLLAMGLCFAGSVAAQANQTGPVPVPMKVPVTVPEPVAVVASQSATEPRGLAAPARDVDLPKILGAADIARYQRIFVLQERGKWKAADRLIKINRRCTDMLSNQRHRERIIEPGGLAIIQRHLRHDKHPSII